MSDNFSNELSDAELERLAILAEEMGEAQQVIGKILRHGYSSINPLKDDDISNRERLERELGDVDYAMQMLCDAKDINHERIYQRTVEKAETIKRWLHHQRERQESQRRAKEEK